MKAQEGNGRRNELENKRANTFFGIGFIVSLSLA